MRGARDTLHYAAKAWATVCDRNLIFKTKSSDKWHNKTWVKSEIIGTLVSNILRSGRLIIIRRGCCCSKSRSTITVTHLGLSVFRLDFIPMQSGKSTRVRLKIGFEASFIKHVPPGYLGNKLEPGCKTCWPVAFLEQSRLKDHKHTSHVIELCRIFVFRKHSSAESLLHRAVPLRVRECGRVRGKCNRARYVFLDWNSLFKKLWYLQRNSIRSKSLI